MFTTCGSYRAVETLKQLELKTASFGNVTEVLILKSRQFSNPWNVLFWLLFISEIFFPSFIVLQQHFLPSLCNLIVRSFSKKHLNNFFSTRSECLCFYLQFVRFENEIAAQSMFINWRTPSWCQCVTVKTEEVGKKMICCAYWRIREVSSVSLKKSLIFSAGRIGSKSKVQTRVPLETASKQKSRRNSKDKKCQHNWYIHHLLLFFRANVFVITTRMSQFYVIHSKSRFSETVCLCGEKLSVLLSENFQISKMKVIESLGIETVHQRPI